jgi:hypothetical protein
LRREKEVVGIIMELIGAGIMPGLQLEALKLAELDVVPMPPPFAPFLPVTTPEPPRASRSAMLVDALCSLDMETPTGKMLFLKAVTIKGPCFSV